MNNSLTLVLKTTVPEGCNLLAHGFQIEEGPRRISYPLTNRPLSATDIEGDKAALLVELELNDALLALFDRSPVGAEFLTLEVPGHFLRKHGKVLGMYSAGKPLPRSVTIQLHE